MGRLLGEGGAAEEAGDSGARRAGSGAAILERGPPASATADRDCLSARALQQADRQAGADPARAGKRKSHRRSPPGAAAARQKKESSQEKERASSPRAFGLRCLALPCLAWPGLALSVKLGRYDTPADLKPQGGERQKDVLSWRQLEQARGSSEAPADWNRTGKGPGRRTRAKKKRSTADKSGKRKEAAGQPAKRRRVCHTNRGEKEKVRRW